MNTDYIIVQAGGKGTRMEKLTVNKPKALVPVNNLPMIFHLFRKFPDKKFIIIGDYKYDVLEKYLNAFADVDFKMADGRKNKGTCSGISEALEMVPDNKSFMLIWCDIVLSEEFSLPVIDDNYIGISKDFVCRWKYENNEFAEERSDEYGVAGLFVFKDKSYLSQVPSNGEFVRWLQSTGYTFNEIPLYRSHEYGLYSEWEKLPSMRCRPFNKIEIKDGRLVKTGIDSQGKSLAVREVNWYKKVQSLKLKNIPEIYGFEPLVMECIDGKNIYEYDDKSYEDKKFILQQIVDCLKKLHAYESVESDENSYRVAYLDKTYDRLSKVKKLVPFAENETVTINGKKCRNIFYNTQQVEKLIMSYFPERFVLLHGDCTFSNMMLKNDSVPVLIDPRGYFGTTELFGDEAYDWAKLYYSLFSNYDRFNLKRFSLKIDENQVFLDIESNNWEDMEEYFFELVGDSVSKKQIKIILAIIWLSLTTYAWEDYDSICGSFYNGLLYLEDALYE